MAPGANSYGTPAQVAALTTRYTSGGAFDLDSNPTLKTVETWIDQVSATLNIALAGAGFKIPITQDDVKAALAVVVTMAVADLVRFANSAGRFYTDKAIENGIDPLRTLQGEFRTWVDREGDGLEMLGATRSRASTAGVLTRGSDQSGNETFPIFQRNGFSNRFTNWDGG